MEATIQALGKRAFTATAHYGAQKHSLTPGPYLFVAGDPGLAPFSTRRALLELVTAFYKKCGIRDFDRLILIRRIGAIGDCLLTNLGADCLDVLSEAEVQGRLRDYGEEFMMFNDYLEKTLD